MRRAHHLLHSQCLHTLATIRRWVQASSCGWRSDGALKWKGVCNIFKTEKRKGVCCSGLARVVLVFWVGARTGIQPGSSADPQRKLRRRCGRPRQRHHPRKVSVRQWAHILHVRLIIVAQVGVPHSTEKRHVKCVTVWGAVWRGCRVSSVQGVKLEGVTCWYGVGSGCAEEGGAE